MAVLGLHVFFQRGPSTLQREMGLKTLMEIESIKTTITYWKQYLRTKYDFCYQ